MAMIPSEENEAPSQAVISTPSSPAAQTTIGDMDVIESSIAQFAERIEHEYGVDIDPEADGAIHRFHDPDGKPGNMDGWYYMHETATKGVFGSWRRGDKHHWSSDTFHALPQDEQETIAACIRNAQEQDAAERLRRQNDAAITAKKRLDGATPASPKHRYLAEKEIKPGNLHQRGNKLLVTMQNTAGQIRNIQIISPSGIKRFLPDGEVKGNFALIGELPDSGTIHVCEGYATAATVHEEFGTPVVAAMNAGNLLPVSLALREHLPDAVDIVIAADDDRDNPDNPGLTMAVHTAKVVNATVIAPNFDRSGCTGTDFNDLANWKDKDPAAPLFREVDLNTLSIMPMLRPLKSQLPPVKPLVASMLHASIAGFVTDTAERLQISPDYIAIAALAIAAGVVGAKVGIHPKQNDDWLIILTLWAGLVGPPSTLKSAALGEAKKPLDELETELAEAYQQACKYYEIDEKLAAGNLKQVEKDAASLFAKNPAKARQDMLDAAFDDPKPVRLRYLINDTTVEKCGEIMSENPYGLLQIRDELSGWIAKQSKEEFQSERAFYLECYDGNSRFTWDRIGRGTVEIENCTLSICGGIQPSKIAPLIATAMDGSTDDGFIQRFQMAVWPDKNPTWKWTDKKPDKAAYEKYRKVIRDLHELSGPNSDKHIGHLRFSKEAQAAFQTWMETLHEKMRCDRLHPVMQSHLGKMPKTISSLALLFELVAGGRVEVGIDATTMAIQWFDYLESHAQRLYSLADDRGINSAKLIVDRRQKLPTKFTSRDVQRRHWSGLKDHQDVIDALETLVEHRYLIEAHQSSGPSGGRPKTLYSWHSSLTKQS